MQQMHTPDSISASYHAGRRRRKVWLRVVSVLSCFVVFCTTYALILPAITIETTVDPNPLFCGNDAHTHSLQCYSDPSADKETAADWTAMTERLNLARVFGNDLVRVALAQLDYRESERNYTVAADGTRQGYTRYGDWSGDAYGDWNAAFVGWCLQYAGITDRYIPYSADPAVWLKLLREQGLLCTANYQPQKGDLVFLDTDRDGTADRVGIVTAYDDADKAAVRLTAVEGDRDKTVKKSMYSLADTPVSGYGSLAPAYLQYLADNGYAQPQTYTVPIYTDGYYTALAADTTAITLDGVLPQGASPRAYAVEATVAGREVLCSYDIAIFLSDGALYEPSQYLTVSITRPELPDTSAVYYVPEIGEPERVITRAEDSVVSFDTGHFSVYAVVDGSADKVTDLQEKPVSAEQSGKVKNFIDGVAEISGQYYSDKITADIEKQFAGVLKDDGKLLTDKSVLYNANDYHTFASYGQDEFSVTLSALAQQYAQDYTVEDKAPIDTVLILDISGSMENTGTTNEKRIEVATQAINFFINDIMYSHPENRIGIVVFANSSAVMLPLGRYYVGSGTPTYSLEGTVPSYIEYTANQYNSSNGGIATNSSLKSVTTDGKGNYLSSQTVTRKGFIDWGGTYTQSGIARAAEMFLAQTTTTYTATTGEVLNRMPVTILLSDGEPTFCTDDYTDVLNGTVYGSGVATNTTNPQGVQGYYTILSANHYKQQIADHYQFTNKDGEVHSYFYSIGMGINETGVDAAGSSTSSGDHYKRATLDPNAERVALLTNTSADNYTVNAYQMYQLLNSDYSGSSITISSASYDASTSNGYTILGTGGTTSSKLSVADNPYTDYAYADEGFFSGDYTTADLNEVMTTILGYLLMNETYTKSFMELTDSVADVHFYDVLGDGMQVTSDFVLRYNGAEYALSRISATDNRQTYRYHGSEEVKPYHNADFTVPLSRITVELSTAADGRQTVHWYIPANLVPELAYYQGLQNTDYYQMFPTRLIYKVGLTDEAKAAVAALAEGEAPLVYYTNAWDPVGTTVDYRPNEGNPYYKNTIAVSTAKENNLTQTAATAYESNGSTAITDRLGNNGKLVFAYQPLVPDTEGETLQYTVNKTWADGNDSHADQAVVMELLADGKVYRTATLNAAGGWTYTWDDLPKYYTDGEAIVYTVREQKVTGYHATVGTPQTTPVVLDYTWENITAFGNASAAPFITRFVYDNEALANTSGTTLTMSALDGMDENQLWEVAPTGSNNYATVRNVATGRYLTASRSGNTYTVTTATSSQNWALVTSGSNLLLRNTSYSNRYLRIGGSSLTLTSAGTAIDAQRGTPITKDTVTVTVINAKPEAASTKPLLIKKDWLNADGSPDASDIHAAITVTLYADGEVYDTVTLDSANNWQTTVEALPVAWKATPDAPIKWTFEESAVDGYISVVGTVDVTETTATVFVPKTAFTDGGVFLITDGVNALTASGSSLTVSSQAASNVNQQWRAEANGNYYRLKNVGTGTYLDVSRSGSWGNYTYSLSLVSSNADSWNLTDNTLQNRSYTNRYLTLDGDGAAMAATGTTLTVGQYATQTTEAWLLPITNRAGLELPATGGKLLFLYIVCGLLFAGGCLMGGVSLYRHRRRVDRQARRQ